MGVDICTAPGCGAFIKDDSLPCPECEGRGFNSVDGTKDPWTNVQWAEHRRKSSG